MANLVVDGIAYSFGLLMPEFKNAFPGSDDSQVALIGSMLCGMYLLVGKVEVLTFCFLAAGLLLESSRMVWGFRGDSCAVIYVREDEGLVIPMSFRMQILWRPNTVAVG